MGCIIKPLVTEKMTAMTEKSSADKQMTSGSKRTVETHNAVEETKSYTVKRKDGKEEKKTKTVYTYVKTARPQYGFIVKPDANKIEIKKEVEQKFNVTVVSVNTIRSNGKSKRRYTRSGVIKGRTNAFKKAIVTLKEGDTIDFYSNI